MKERERESAHVDCRKRGDTCGDQREVNKASRSVLSQRHHSEPYTGRLSACHARCRYLSVVFIYYLLYLSRARFPRWAPAQHARQHCIHLYIYHLPGHLGTVEFVLLRQLYIVFCVESPRCWIEGVVCVPCTAYCVLRTESIFVCCCGVGSP